MTSNLKDKKILGAEVKFIGEFTVYVEIEYDENKEPTKLEIENKALLEAPVELVRNLRNLVTKKISIDKD